jgi:hypothetical protein
MAGNLPGFLRHLKPVMLHGQLPGGEAVEITICVTPDYLALGSDTDFLRIPMGLRTAHCACDRGPVRLRAADAEDGRRHLRPSGSAPATAAAAARPRDALE